MATPPRHDTCSGSKIPQPRLNFNAPSLQPEPPRTIRNVANNDRPMQSPIPLSTPPARALLCGITYKGNKRSIKSSIDDVKLMKNFLIKRGFDDSSIRLLTEEERDPSRIPTKSNILEALRWLVQGCRSGDSLVFYYSGHVSQVQGPNYKPDEVDRHHEALLPVDHETEGIILDDDINSIIVKPLTPGVTLHAIIDTCFNGTLLNLPYVSKMDGGGGYKWIHNPQNKGASRGLAIFISACDDNQKSGEAASALTDSFVKALEKKPKQPYKCLLIDMHDRIRKAQKEGSTKTAAPQEPKLSASKDIYEMPCTI